MQRRHAYEPMIMLHTCKHVLHLKCLEQFIRRCQDSTMPIEERMSKKVCPICRQKFSQIRSPRTRGLSRQKRSGRSVVAKRDGSISRETHHLLSNLKLARCMNNLKKTENRLEKELCRTQAGARHRKQTQRSFRMRSEKTQPQKLPHDGIFEESGVIL